MKTKSSAHYQREYRRRLREKGLIKKEIWIRPEHANLLSSIEQQLRIASTPTTIKGARVMADQAHAWTTATLYNSLREADMFNNGQASVEMVEGVDPSLHIVMKEYGDLPVFLTVSGEQIVAEAILWSLEEVADRNNFNETVLRTHKYFPLSTISLDKIDGEGDYYHMFGALSATSHLSNILLEIETLASNVIQATEAYGEFLVSPAATNQ